MKLSTRTRYGIRAILELADNYGKGPLQLKIIAEREDISIKYLEQLMAILKSSGLVRSVRGSKGGYVLAKEPEKIKVSDCFKCLEGPMVTVECVDDNNFCARTTDCVARQLWSEVQQAMMAVLESLTLKDLVGRTKTDRALDYSI